MSRKKFSDLSNLFILVKLFLHPDLYTISLKIERHSNSPSTIYSSVVIPCKLYKYPIALLWLCKK